MWLLCCFCLGVCTSYVYFACQCGRRALLSNEIIAFFDNDVDAASTAHAELQKDVDSCHGTASNVMWKDCLLPT